MGICPDTLVQNEMPSIEPSNNSKYTVAYKGEIIEISGLGAQWVKENCKTEIKTIN
ncbi:MAG: hypothetical protein WCI04_00650 [archaeon]